MWKTEVLRELKDYIIERRKVNIDRHWRRRIEMSSTTAFLVLILVFFVSHGSCNEENKEPELNGTKIKWNDNFAEESSEGSGLKTEYDAKGLQPWYDFANSFISTVLNKEPYGKLIVSFLLFCFHFLQ